MVSAKWHHIPEGQHWHLHWCANLKSHLFILCCSLWQITDTMWYATHHLTTLTIHATSISMPLISTAWSMTWSQVPSTNSPLRLSRWGSLTCNEEVVKTAKRYCNACFVCRVAERALGAWLYWTWPRRQHHPASPETLLLSLWRITPVLSTLIGSHLNSPMDLSQVITVLATLCRTLT